jgi:hypothetical protein
MIWGAQPLPLAVSISLWEYRLIRLGELIGGFFHFSERENNPEPEISMKPDLTLLTDGFSGHKEIKFTNLVPLPTPVDSTRSELFFFHRSLLSCRQK